MLKNPRKLCTRECWYVAERSKIEIAVEINTILWRDLDSIRGVLGSVNNRSMMDLLSLGRLSLGLLCLLRRRRWLIMNWLCRGNLLRRLLMDRLNNTIFKCLTKCIYLMLLLGRRRRLIDGISLNWWLLSCRIGNWRRRRIVIGMFAPSYNIS